MIWWLVITPLLAWILAGTVGLRLIKGRPENAVLPSETTHGQQPQSTGLAKAGGWLLIANAILLTFMSIMAATGVVAPASN